MSVSTVLSPIAARRGIVGVAVLVAGVVAGIASVYSDSRVGCATWVTAALLLTLAAGLLLGPLTSRPLHRDR